MTGRLLRRAYLGQLLLRQTRASRHLTILRPLRTPVAIAAVLVTAHGCAAGQSSAWLL